MESICSVQDIAVTDSNGILGEHIDLEIYSGDIIGLISENGASDILLQCIGGLNTTAGGQIQYMDSLYNVRKGVSTKVQYVPDDIVCYFNLSVEEFLIAASIAAGEEAANEQSRLCSLFGIDIKENLLDMTFEQNRLISYILAISMTPEILLIDRPADMISRNTFRQLGRELDVLHKKGTAIVMSERAYANLTFPCEKYLFIRKEDVKSYTRQALPRPAKVITVINGSIEAVDVGKYHVLFSEEQRTRFLCHEYNADDLIVMLQQTGCKDFTVENLSMEETIYENYKRWLP